MTLVEKQKILDCLNSMEVIEQSGGEEAYALVENNEENRKLLEEAGIPLEKALGYGDDETFCIFALAFNEGYANWYDGTNLLWKDERTLEELKNEIQTILDSPLTDFEELHRAIQGRLNSY